MAGQIWRSGTRGIVACFLGILAYAGNAAPDTRAIRRRLSPAPSIVRVENGGLLFTDNSAGVSGTDCGYSLSIGARTLWLFGDVFLLQPSAPTRTFVGGVSNCALLVPKGHGFAPLRSYKFLTNPKTGLARQVIPNEAGEDNRTRL